MSKSYGLMDSFDNCIKWVEELEVKDPEYKDRVLNRLRYERDKAKPVKPTFRKGKYGKQFDTYTCGRCGFSVNEPVYRFCPNCGFAINWREAEK